jgi:hypothetical protein
MKVDASVYTPEGAKHAKALGAVGASKGMTRFNPYVCELAVECKPLKEDPFTFGHAQHATHPRRQALGQIISYAAEIIACQHRTHLFTVLAIGESQFRLFRWDSAGVVVTRLESDPVLLEDFFRRFNSASPAQRGLDPSVRWATADEEAIFKENVTAFGRDELELRGDDLASFEQRHYEEHRVAVMQVGNSSVRIAPTIAFNVLTGYTRFLSAVRYVHLLGLLVDVPEDISAFNWSQTTKADIDVGS